MDLADWLTLAAVCWLGAASPGPSLAVVVKHTMAGGRSSGMVVAWCHACGVGAYAVATVFGLAALLVLYPAVDRTVTLAGAAYLLFLGYRALRAGWQTGAVAVGTAPTVPLGESARDGLSIALLNPKIALFFTALFSQFVHPDGGVAQQWAMAGTAFAIDGVWYSIVAVVLARPALLRRFHANAHWVNRASGVLFIGLAVRVALG